MMNQAQQIQNFICQHVQDHPQTIVRHTMEHFGVSRTTVLRHMNHLIKRGKIIKSGRTRQIIYSLANHLQQQFVVPLDEVFDEHYVFTQYLKQPIVQHGNANTYEICEYGVCEMLNNSWDHSQGRQVKLAMTIDEQFITIMCQDDGVGLFRQLATVLDTDDPRSIMFELSKGKVTSNPSAHSGEGLFFTSRAFDQFTLEANAYAFYRDNIEQDWSFMDASITTGTRVELKIERHSERKLAHVFERYQSNDDFEFSQTEVLIDLAKDYGKRLIARSQAKRVTQNLDSFTHVVLDFKHVEAVGQGFVDQIFRVYQNQRPQLTIDYMNANDNVDFMIRRGVRGFK